MKERNASWNEYEQNFSDSGENILGKGEIAHYEQFLLFPKCFQTPPIVEVSKCVYMWERVKTDPDDGIYLLKGRKHCSGKYCSKRRKYSMPPFSPFSTMLSETSFLTTGLFSKGLNAMAQTNKTRGP